MIQPLALAGIASVVLGGCVAAVLGDAPQSGTAADTRLSGARDSGGRLRSAVRGRLAADAALSGATIEVAASGGGVTLTGTALSAAQSSTAARDAMATAGVSSVVNQIKVP